MLQEPFWLGLITVTVVLGVIGLVWCAKRHFPEKLEKLLAEEADRSRTGSYIKLQQSCITNIKIVICSVLWILSTQFCRARQDKRN